MSTEKTPLPSQMAAIVDADAHCLVVAGAGTGKTFTVVHRILYALGVPVAGRTHPHPCTLDEIAAITFTNQAANELKEDLRQAMRAAGRRHDAYAVDHARIGTIHGFCGELLRENSLRRGVPPSSVVLEEGEATSRATQAARDALVEALETGAVPGLAELLAMWETSRVDRWTVDLMKQPDLVASLTAEPAGLDERERAVAGLAKLAIERHVARLLDDGVLDFDRMILWTRDLLRDDADARRSLQRSLRLLIIDEFQDVDPAQKEIAYAIGEPTTGAIDTPRLMLVGDPKQSIYRFRRADVTVWNGVEAEFGTVPHCSVHALEENFRGVPAILAFVDASVGVLLDRPVRRGDNAEAGTAAHPDDRAILTHSAYEVRYRPVSATREAGADTRPVELYVTPSNAKGTSYLAGEVRWAEAQAIARRARELHDTGTPWREMALLLAAWANEQVYTGALRDAGAPVYVLRDVGFYDQREVVDMILALQAARDPSDDTALIGWLRSPFVGLRDDSLLHIARQAGYPPYWPKLRDIDLPDPAESERLRGAIELLWDAIQLRDRVPAADLLDRMLRDTGYLAHLQLLGEEGLHPIANVRRFMDHARAMNAVGVGDLLRAIRESRERDDRVGVARLYDATEDVLLVTSIHVSKGLEWPVVFWADLGAWSRGISEELLISRDTIRLGTPEAARDEAPDWQALRQQLTDEAEAERKRLWYVASTRARDRLVISGIARGLTKAGSLGYEMLQLFPTLGDPETTTLEYEGADGTTYLAVVRETPDPAGIESDRPPHRAGTAAIAESPAATEPGSLAIPPAAVPTPVGLTRHSATEFLAHARCARRHAFKYVLGIREPALNSSSNELISAVARGQIVHDVLERHAEDAELDALLEDAIGRWDDNAPAPDSDRGIRYREHLADEVTRILDHPDYAGIVARPGARRELAFLHILPDGAVAQGFMDLAAPDAAGDGVELLDVKTTQCDADVAAKKAEHYGPQRDVYTVAAEAITGRPVTRFAFQFSRARTQIAVDLDDRDRHEARGRVARHVHDIEWPDGDVPPLTTFAGECDFCGDRRVGLCPGVNTGDRDPRSVLRRLRNDRFRRSFNLRGADLDYLRETGIATVLEHAHDFIAKRLAPAQPANDGRQTPWRGHPVFVAQHATATCCRVCLEQWHGIERGRPLSNRDSAYVVHVIEAWLSRYDPGTLKDGPTGTQLELL
jgi:ATP-dependent helicase/nuclease subunit A